MAIIVKCLILVLALLCLIVLPQAGRNASFRYCIAQSLVCLVVGLFRGGNRPCASRYGQGYIGNSRACSGYGGLARPRG